MESLDSLFDNTPVSREVTVKGKTVTAYFKRITAGQRQQLLKGQKVSTQGGNTVVELDLEKNEISHQQMVLFSVCKEDGSPYFASLEKVQKADALVVSALFKVASEVNAEDEEPGKD